MTEVIERPATLPLVAAVALGSVAGFVDAVCFVRLFDVFPANQSGNAILLGIGLGDGSATEAWRPAIAMVGFTLGVAAAVALRRSGRVPSPTRALIAVELALLAVVALTVGSVLDVTEELGGVSGATLLLLTALAMGVQTEIIRSHAGVSISTTFQTGALTRIAEGVAGGGGLGTPAHRSAERRAAVAAATILTSVLVGYVVGAALGARVGDEWSAALAVPLAALAALLVTERWWSATTGT